ncbi:MAG: hypothetical protein K6G76_02985 [Lachnospiraceae bacterium]|nr:hypothetical protein [Lachnospiraceae bacterium]
MKIRITDSQLVFALGTVANISVLNIFGNTLYIYLSYGILLFLLLRRKQISFSKNFYSLYLASIIIGCVLCQVNSNFENGWKTRSVIVSINMIVTYLLFGFIFKSDELKEKLFQGVYLGCLINLGWCYLQIVLYNLMGTDINLIVFNFPSQIKNGKLVYSALVTHAGILVPVLVIGFLVSDLNILKVLFCIAAVMTRNATCMIAMAVCVFFYVVIVSKNGIRGIGKKKVVYICLTLIVAIAFVLILWDKFNLAWSFRNVTERIYSLTVLRKVTSGSDATHLRYLTSFPMIASRLAPINFMFGSGMGTSGYYMSHYFGQYIDKIWVVECDVIDIFYSVGLIGAFIFYASMAYIFFKGYKINKRYSVFSLTITIAGFFYNFQMPWLYLIEFIMLWSVKNNVDCWGFFKLYSEGKNDYKKSTCDSY